jgi:S1-C subfamily serine protease
MPDIHPYAAELADTIRRRSNQRTNLKFRTLLQGFGFRRRTPSIVSDIHTWLNDCGLVSDFSVDIPAGLDERVAIALAEPSALPLPTQPLPQKQPQPAIPDLADIAESALAATVEVFTESGAGSGFIVHSDGLVVTGRHVVEEDVYSLRSVKVRLADNQVIEGIVFRSHRQLDFALLWLLADGPFPTLPIGNPRKLRAAQTVLAIGSPFGLSKTVTKGIVSNPQQKYNRVECIQTDASIDHGNSGGPLVSQDGVVGINLWGLGNLDSGKFAVPMDYLTQDIAEALKYGRNKCLKATYCLACGFTDYGRSTWYCRNCGVQFAQESQATDK